VIVDPVAESVTHLVVEPEHRRGLGRLVPLGPIDATSGEVRLSCTQAEFGKLEPAEGTRFIREAAATRATARAGACVVELMQPDAFPEHAGRAFDSLMHGPAAGSGRSGTGA
jgi:hypothetical protein